VATRQRPDERGREIARTIAIRIGGEIRRARIAAGLSLRAAADAVGLSHSVFSRLERGSFSNVTVVQLSLACTAVGLDFSAAAHPGGDPVRDAGHLRLLSRVRAVLPAGTRWRSEVPIAIPGDRRGIDGVAWLDPRPTGLEAETRLGDLQALERRTLQKQRDAGLTVLILVIADTRHNRRVLAVHREALRSGFPLDGRAMITHLKRGSTPPANGLVLL
jgi:transcriptional regulator with XRE-family HTH domain